MKENPGLFHALVLDGEGGARDLDPTEVEPEIGPSRLIWTHWDRKHPETKAWLRERSGLDPLICEALLAEETRPRCFSTEKGFFAILRGVNLNPNSDPEDMVSVRLWLESARMITLRGPRVMAVQEIRERLSEGKGPVTGADILVELISKLIDRMGTVLEELNDEVDSLEERVVAGEQETLRPLLSHLRRQCISLRRYLSPQREVLSRLATERIEGFSEIHRGRIREAMDRLIRYIEDLDSIRERAAVTQEELAGILSEQLNSRMYLLSLVAGIFLPLGLLTGLLGINVGGVPGTENDWAFAVVCVILVALTLIGYWVLRKLKFF